MASSSTVPKNSSFASNPSQTARISSTATESQSTGLDPETDDAQPPQREPQPQLEPQPPTLCSPLIDSYNAQMRWFLGKFNAKKESSQPPPAILVIGDHSSGKSSVLDTLVGGIGLPGRDVTRVPLIIRLEGHTGSDSEFWFECKYVKETLIDKSCVGKMIDHATTKIVGTRRKGFSDEPLNLVMKNSGFPDMRLIDFPGIDREPGVKAQVKDMIEKYVEQKESIILGVVSAGEANFLENEAIKFCRRLDQAKERTLVVVTKADIAPIGLSEKISDERLGHVCVVRNKNVKENYVEGRLQELKLFETHNLLSKIDKSLVGIHSLAQKLLHIHACIITRRFENASLLIAEALCDVNLPNRLPKNFSTEVDVMIGMFKILDKAKVSLMKVIIAQENDEYATEVHWIDNFHTMMIKCRDELLSKGKERDTAGNFLMQETQMLEKTKTKVDTEAFSDMVGRKVDDIVPRLNAFVCEFWSDMANLVDIFLEKTLVCKKLNRYSMQLGPTKRAAKNTIAKMKEKSAAHLTNIAKQEKNLGCTMNPGFPSDSKQLLSSQEKFMEIVNDPSGAQEIEIEGFNVIKVGDLRHYKQVAEQAFILKMKTTAYWKVAQWRMVDSVALNLLSAARELAIEFDTLCLREHFGPDPDKGIMIEKNDKSSSVAEELSG